MTAYIALRWISASSSILGSFAAADYPSVVYAEPAGRPAISMGMQRTVSDTLPMDTLAARLATITTDTGAFAPGRRDFTRYTAPGLCRAAAQFTRRFLQRTVEAETRLDTLRIDTVGTGKTAAVARTCGTHFTLADTAAQDQLDLFALAIQEANDPLALSVLDRLVKGEAEKTSKPDIDQYDEFGFNAYIQYRRLTGAESLLRHIEERGPSTRRELIWLNKQIAEQYGDVDIRRRQHIDAYIRLAMQTDHDGDTYGVVVRGYHFLMRTAAMIYPDSLPVIAQRAKRDLAVFPPSVQPKIGVMFGPVDTQWDTVSVERTVLLFTPGWYEYRMKAHGQQASRLHADYWFPTPGRAKRDTVRPLRNVVNMICQAGNFLPGLEPDYRNGNGWYLSSNYYLAGQVRRWLALYGAKGLDVTIVHAARGNTDCLHGSELDCLSLLSNPLLDAQSWRWYDQEYEQMPVTVAIQVIHDTWLPLPDGRRLTESALQYDGVLTNTVPNDNGEPGRCAIVGRDGNLVSNGERERGDYDILLRLLFTGQSAVTSSAPIGVSPTASPSLSPRATPGTL